VERRESLIDLNARSYLKRAIPVADKDGVSVAVTQRYDQIQDAIAIQVANTNIIAGGKKVAARNQRDHWLPRKRSISHAQQNRELGVPAADRHILDSIAIEISYRHGHRTGPDINLIRRLKCTVSVAEQNSNAARRTARCGETSNVMHYYQIELAVAIEIRRCDGGLIESGRVWEKSRCVEGARASAGKKCEAELRSV